MVVARESECLDDETAARFAGGRATPTEIADIEVHLDSCATCRRTVAALAHAAPRCCCRSSIRTSSPPSR